MRFACCLDLGVKLSPFKYRLDKENDLHNIMDFSISFSGGLNIW